MSQERGAPELIFLRQAFPGPRIELVIVDKGKTLVYQISGERAARLLEQLTEMRPAGEKNV